MPKINPPIGGKKSGWSLVELIVVIAIFGILAVAAFVSFGGFRNAKTLETTVDEAVSLLNEARSKTLSSEDDSQYGVRFENFKMTLFKGDGYSSSSPSNKITAISPLVEISSVSLSGGGSDVVFQKINGKTGNFGSLIFRVKSDTSQFKTLNISSTGSVGI